MERNGTKASMLLSVLLLWCVSVRGTVHVTGLRTEQAVRPLGVESEHPRLSWVTESDERGVMQTGYRVLVASSPEKLESGESDLWDSGDVESGESVWIPYGGASLKPNERCYWKVKVRTTKGWSDWSEPGEWGMGLMGEIHWGGSWIGWDGAFAWDREESHSRMSARYLRTEFKTRECRIRRATVHVCGLGLYELFIGGHRVGESVLTPAPTDYRRTVLYDSYDVTDMLSGNGSANAIGVTLGNGRFYTMRQRYKPWKIPTFGYPKLRLTLIVEYTDGSTQRVSSDGTWRLTAEGPIRSNNEYDGEEYDARMELGAWTDTGYDDSKWLAAQRVSPPEGTLRGASAPSMKVKERLSPVNVERRGGRYIADFGQNTAGWVRLSIRRGASAAGDTIRIRYAERLTDEGEIDVENLRSARSEDCYVADGREDGREWSSRFSYHGFQYVEVTGYENLRAEDLVAEVVYDDFAEAGSFECSDETLNRIFKNARRGIASNYKGVPVDCPQRDERQPWLGDHAMGTWGESFMFGCGRMYAKWTDDIREAQREDGCIPNICPAFYNYYTPDMTWSSTLAVVCDMLWRQEGDTAPIRRNYGAMKRWLDFIRKEYTSAAGLITADKYGDWCVPPEEPGLIHSKDSTRLTDGKLIATAYYYKMCKLMEEFARLQDMEVDASAWAADAARVRESFNRSFLTVKCGTSPAAGHWLYPDSVFYGNNTVTANLLPLAFDMVPENLRPEVERNLVTALVTRHGGHAVCGVPGMNWLFRELTRMGRGDVACEVARGRTYPSFGYMIEKGATAIWELWNGDTASRKMNSLNHVMLLGDLVSWFFRDVAGISPSKPGYKEILFRPDFSIEELSHAEAWHETPYGKVESRWRRAEGRLVWDITVPCNTTATVVLPTRDENAVTGEDGFTFTGRTSEGGTSWRVLPGTYHIDIPLDATVMPGLRAGVTSEEFLYEETSFPECHAASIVETEDGGLLAAFFGGTKERNPDCCVWTCRKEAGARKWSAPVLAADGVFVLGSTEAETGGVTEADARAGEGPVSPSFQGDTSRARRKACWNPVLFRMPGSGEVSLFFKVGKNVGDWSGWIVRSKDGGRTWSAKEALPVGFLGPSKNKPEFVGGNIVCPGSTEGKDGWRVHFELSDDGGRTWRKSGPLEAESDVPTHLRKGTDAGAIKPIQAIQPSILRHGGDTLQVLCRTRNGKLATSWSGDGGDTWSALTLTDVPNNNSGTDAVTLGDGRHVLVYNDFGTLDGTPKGVRTPLCVALSRDGLHWRKVSTLENSPVGQYSYPAVTEGSDGLIHVIYTWRRRRIRHIVLDLNQLLTTE